MVRVSKRQKLQKKGSTSEQSNNRNNEPNQDPELVDSALEPTTVEKETCQESDSTAEYLLIHQKLNLALEKIKDMTGDISFLLNEVDGLKKELNLMKSELDSRKQLAENIESPSVISSAHNATATSLVVTKQENIDTSSMTGPFSKYEPINRVVPRPSSRDIVTTIGGKAHSLQFTVNLYVDLIEKILGPAENTNLDYRAMVKEAILVTKAVVSDLKEVHNIDSNLRWSHVDPTIKLEAYKKLEDATEHLLPLKVCSEFWGAHVLISNFWLKRKKSTITKKKQQSPNTTKAESPPPNKDPVFHADNDNNEAPNENTLPQHEDTPTYDNNTTKNNPNSPKKPKAFSIPFLTHP